MICKNRTRRVSDVDDEGVQVDEDEDGDDAPHEVLNPRVGHHDLTNKHGEC